MKPTKPTKPIKPVNIGFSLAADALRSALQKSKVQTLSISELQRLCAQETRPRILSYYLRSQREAINTLIASVFADHVSDLEKEFLFRHYGKGHSILKISMHIPMSERQIYDMQKQLLRHLSALLAYRASDVDAYFPIVGLNLLNILDIRMATFTMRAQTPVADGFLERITEAREKWARLLLLQRQMMDERNESELARAVRARIAHPHVTVAELKTIAIPELSSVPISTVHAHLREYMARVSECLRPRKQRTERSIEP